MALTQPDISYTFPHPHFLLYFFSHGMLFFAICFSSITFRERPDFEDLKKVIFKSKKLLKVNGKLIIEIGHKQKNICTKILNENNFYINKSSKDLSGKDRCIVSTKLQ